MTRLHDLVRHEREGGLQFPRWIDRIVSAGIASQDPKVVRRQRITNVAALAGSLNAFSRALANLFYEADHYLLMQAVFLGLSIAALFIHRLHRMGDNVAAVALVAWFLAGVSASSVAYGLNAQTQAYFVLAGILWVTVGLENWRIGVAGLIAVLAVTLAVLNYVPAQGLAVSGDGQAVKFLAMQSLINAITINAMVLVYALFLLRHAEQELERQRARAEALVSVVLPEPIAQRLRSGDETRIADRIEGVSVLFADLVDFTPVAHAQPPEAVVDYLDELVRSLDLMCETFGVDKIKTIGDSYMAAGGLHLDRVGGITGIGRLALEMIKAQERRAPLGHSKLQLRVGIHYGTAIAGVIGDTRISYDLWGDAVNFASRMQSHGVPGRIQVSEEYRNAAKDLFEFEERGDTRLKGLGVARTFFLLGMHRQGEGADAAA